MYSTAPSTASGSPNESRRGTSPPHGNLLLREPFDRQERDGRKSTNPDSEIWICRHSEYGVVYDISSRAPMFWQMPPARSRFWTRYRKNAAAWAQSSAPARSPTCCGTTCSSFRCGIFRSTGVRILRKRKCHLSKKQLEKKDLTITDSLRIISDVFNAQGILYATRLSDEEEKI